MKTFIIKYMNLESDSNGKQFIVREHSDYPHHYLISDGKSHVGGGTLAKKYCDKVYPEHEKLDLVKDQSQQIGEFLEWMNSKGIQFGKYDSGDKFLPHRQGISSILSEYFDIDQTVLEREKVQMLDDLRHINLK